jgi:hypothetical protein
MSAALPIPDRVDVDDPDVTLCRACLGVTLWTDDPLRWAQQGAAALFALALALPSAARLRWYTTSAMDTWAGFDAEARAQLAEGLPLPFFQTVPRHLLGLRVSDALDAPSVSFRYREVDPVRTRARGCVQVIIPLDEDPGALFQLVMEAASTLPFWCGTAGVVASWDPLDREASLRAVHPWSRRFAGMDVQDPDGMGFDVNLGLPGVAWLTLVGEGFAAARSLDLDALARTPWAHDVAAMRTANGLVLRAGATPDPWDLNLLRAPDALREVARALDPWVLAAPRDFDGWPEGETALWMHRLARPEALR